eukprot:2220217-Alexandrium_andersonii.AAC.1
MEASLREGCRPRSHHRAGYHCRRYSGHAVEHVHPALRAVPFTVLPRCWWSVEAGAGHLPGSLPLSGLASASQGLRWAPSRSPWAMLAAHVVAASGRLGVAHLRRPPG